MIWNFLDKPNRGGGKIGILRENTLFWHRKPINQSENRKQNQKTRYCSKLSSKQDHQQFTVPKKHTFSQHAPFHSVCCGCNRRVLLSGRTTLFFKTLNKTTEVSEVLSFQKRCFKIMTKSYNVLPCLFWWARGSFWASAVPGECLRWLLKLFWKKSIFRKCAILQKVVMNESLQHEEESSMRRDNEMATSLWDLGRPWKSLRKQNDLVVSETRVQRWTKMIVSIWLQFEQLFITSHPS